SVVELTVSWQERRPIAPGSKMESNRLDVGVFVHNGKHYSAPGFVTFFSLYNQKRVYDKTKRIGSGDYDDEEARGNYGEPLVDMQKDWRDEYRHDKEGRLLGWTRVRGKEKQDFTADGALVVEKDEKGRALKARTVCYIPKPRQGKAGLLARQPSDTDPR